MGNMETEAFSKEIEFFDPGLNGTDNYTAYRTFSNAHILLTDSVKAWATEFGAFWALDVVMSYLPQINRKIPQVGDFFLIQIILTKRGCTYTISSDSGEEPFIRQRIGFTDLPHNVKLYLSDNVLMFPSDY